MCAHICLMLSKTSSKKEKQALIPCACGCCEQIDCFDKWGRKRFYMVGHTWKNRKMSLKSRQKMSIARMGKSLSVETRKKIGYANSGEKHYEWKGDLVGNDALHRWVKKQLPKPQLCQFCYKVSPKELANITGIYNRALENWKYLCIKCHRWFDWRVKKAEMEARICFICGSNWTYRDKKNRQVWYKHQEHFICSKCYSRRYAMIKARA